jgi:hypothetical protein
MDKLSIEAGSGPVKQNQNESLTAEKSSRLKKLEETIASGSLAAGQALLEIHEQKLYLGEYRSWKEYCNKRWDCHRSYAYRLIKFAKASKEAEVSTNGDTENLKSEGSFRASKTKEKQPSKLITKLEVEFAKFRQTVERWEEGLSREDYLRLVSEVSKYTDDILCEAGYAGDIAVSTELEEVAS